MSAIRWQRLTIRVREMTAVFEALRAALVREDAVEAEAGAEALLARMDRRVREVFLMRMIDRMSYRAIARESGLSDRDVEKLLLRAFVACAEWGETHEAGCALPEAR